MQKRKLITLLLFVLFFAIPFSTVFANDKFLVQTETQKLHPNNPFYPAKRLWEKIAAKLLIFSDPKINYEKMLLNKRFSELKYTVENNLLDEIQRSSERFSYQAGIFADKTKAEGNSETKKKAIQEFSKYASDASILRKRVPEGSFTRLIQYDIDTLNILSDQLK